MGGDSEMLSFILMVYMKARHAHPEHSRLADFLLRWARRVDQAAGPGSEEASGAPGGGPRTAPQIPCAVMKLLVHRAHLTACM